jgi:hypothetical protein
VAVIPRTVLVVASGFPRRVSALRASSAIARGIRTVAPVLEIRVYRLSHPPCELDQPRRELREAPRRSSPSREFEGCLRAARAIVLADRDLHQHERGAGATFELASGARQGGVPAYAVTVPDEPDLFVARMLDLQVVLQAGDERTLVSAGEKLGQLI